MVVEVDLDQLEGLACGCAYAHAFAALWNL
jgi:hypothetical protein